MIQIEIFTIKNFCSFPLLLFFIFHDIIAMFLWPLKVSFCLLEIKTKHTTTNGEPLLDATLYQLRDLTFPTLFTQSINLWLPKIYSLCSCSLHFVLCQGGLSSKILIFPLNPPLSYVPTLMMTRLWSYWCRSTTDYCFLIGTSHISGHNKK